MIALKAAARATALTVAVVASMSFARPARASDVSFERTPSSYAALVKMKPMEVMHLMDADNQGSVTKEQFMKFHEAMFDKMDKDKDGKLSREEWLDRIHSGA
jgi:EF hand